MLVCPDKAERGVAGAPLRPKKQKAELKMSEDDEPAEVAKGKLHKNHGKECANPECDNVLVTGRIRAKGLCCADNQCRNWAERQGLVTKRSKPHAQPDQENRHPQQAWADGARSAKAAKASDEQPPPKPPQQRVSLHSVHRVRGACPAEGLDRNDVDPETMMLYVEGVFVFGPARREQARWVAEAEVQRVLGGRAAIGSLWAGPTFATAPAAPAEVAAAPEPGAPAAMGDAALRAAVMPLFAEKSKRRVHVVSAAAGLSGAELRPRLAQMGILYFNADGTAPCAGTTADKNGFFHK